MNPTSNKSDFEDLTTNLRDLAYSYLEKYSPSKQQLKVYLLNFFIIKKITFSFQTKFLLSFSIPIFLIVLFFILIRLSKSYLTEIVLDSS